MASQRIIRDWTDSETIDQLSYKGEVFFTRLCMKADDFGYYHANVKLLKAAIFPLRDEITLVDIKDLLDELTSVGLVQLYTANKKEYLFIPKFGQRLRIMKSKFPPVPDDGQQLTIKPVITEEKAKVPFPNPTENMVDMYLKDLPNSSHLQDISRRVGINVEILKTRIPDFSKAAEISYPTHEKFLSHFKNWVLKNPTVTTNNKTSHVFGKGKTK